MIGHTVSKLINFNGTMTLTTGIVVGSQEDSWIVDFHHLGTDFRGLWNKKECR